MRRSGSPKARRAPRSSIRRPTKALEDTVAAGGGAYDCFALEGLTPLEGGLPIVVDGKIVGGIGVSGVASKDDAQIAQAGANAVK